MFNILGSRNLSSIHTRACIKQNNFSGEQSEQHMGIRPRVNKIFPFFLKSVYFLFLMHLMTSVWRFLPLELCMSYQWSMVQVKANPTLC